MMASRKISSEQEFQGMVLYWVNAELVRRPGISLDAVTQEVSKLDRKRNDVVVWKNRASHDGYFCISPQKGIFQCYPFEGVGPDRETNSCTIESMSIGWNDLVNS